MHVACSGRPGEVEAQLPAPVLARVQAEAGEPFDLGAGPLVRARLIRLTPQDHLLLLTMHHTVADGWSVKVPFPFPPMLLHLHTTQQSSVLQRPFMLVKGAAS